ncbi:hypothetical protein J4E83_005274 [Alternaria metachromatica]|uniref:uncharacterized protein n=1 Tax=Alternaria metachromatica TaxID=283354 RepID=UPI0020C342FB|nr:uncharacterized protein J4E83_005274 [Alternaria metachromatica]KAI4620911.1 hypothetical protein J4E83_005274 [Alternaria metachromatica]
MTTGTATNTTSITPAEGVVVTRLPMEDDLELPPSTETKSIFHIYEKHKCHKSITPVLDPNLERRSGPTIKEQKATRKKERERQDAGLSSVEPDDNAFFLHRPYLAFHVPPQVLYTGSSKHTAQPAILIHEGCFWKEYTLQLLPSTPGILDPRGVVPWRHNGGDEKALKGDHHKLKGYKVRTWRLWGETGKDYVRSVKNMRKTGEGRDPDVIARTNGKLEEPATADEVVYLRWKSPLSRNTRCYHFQYVGIDFFWKGTGTIKETRTCGVLLRFNHLKLVARLPVTEEKKEKPQEVCLGVYTSSVASRKSGTMEFFDAVILRLVDEYAPDMPPRSENGTEEEETESARLLRMKRSRLYQVFVATAMCMIKSEKEKRHTLLDLLVNVAEGGAGG